MTQSYEHMHLFVAAKGISEYDFNEGLKSQFERFIDGGKLTLRHFPNKNQLSNFVDTVRDLDISEYDLFAKIDDDDFYHPDYFKRINEFHDSIPDSHSSYFSRTGYIHYSTGGYSLLSREHFHLFGPTMVFSAPVMEKIILCEKNPDSIASLVPRAARERADNHFGFTEDNLMHMIMREYGESNIGPWLEERTNSFHLMIQRNNASVIRGGLLHGDFRVRNLFVNNDDRNHEHIIRTAENDCFELFRVIDDQHEKLEKK